jgi:hypothetical protein
MVYAVVVVVAFSDIVFVALVNGSVTKDAGIEPVADVRVVVMLGLVANVTVPVRVVDESVSVHDKAVALVCVIVPVVVDVVVVVNVSVTVGVVSLKVVEERVIVVLDLVKDVKVFEAVVDDTVVPLVDEIVLVVEDIVSDAVVEE